MLNWINNLLGFHEKSGEPTRSPFGIDIAPAEDTLVYAIGDIHGRLDLLKEAERKIEADARDRKATVVYLGDYVDRGPDSAWVIDHLKSADTERFRRICLRGNHEELFIRFLDDPTEDKRWLEFGGKETLRSYKIPFDLLSDTTRNPRELVDLLQFSIPASHKLFLNSTKLWARYGRYVFVHAGLKPGIKLESQDPSDLLWIREPFLTSGPEMPITVVHGHTPKPEISHGPSRIGIDTGAYATGKLTTVRVTADSVEEI